MSCWLPIDWKTTGCGRTDKGGCGLTGEGRDTDRSNDHLYLPDFLSFPWNECSCCCSGGLGSDSPALKIQAAASRPTAASPAGNLSPCSHPAVHRTVLTPLRSPLYTILPPSFPGNHGFLHLSFFSPRCSSFPPPLSSFFVL